MSDGGNQRIIELEGRVQELEDEILKYGRNCGLDILTDFPIEAACGECVWCKIYEKRNPIRLLVGGNNEL